VSTGKIGAGRGALVEFDRSEYLVLEDRAGSSSVLLVLFNASDVREYLSLSHTRLGQGNIFLLPASSLLSNRRNLMARVIEDGVRAHDIISGAVGEDRLPANVISDLAAKGIEPWAVPECVRLFTPVEIGEDESLVRRCSVSRRGDRFVLLGGMPCLCALVVPEGEIGWQTRRQMPAKV